MKPKPSKKVLTSKAWCPPLPMSIPDYMQSLTLEMQLGDLEQLLKTLKLQPILEVLERELNRAEEKQTSYSELLTRLFREQYYASQVKGLHSRIKRANIPDLWSLETFPFKKQPSVRAATIRQLATLDFVPKSENIVFIGEAGLGKTALATGILLKAIEGGYTGLFIKAQKLFDDMYSSLADHSSRRLLNRLMRIDLLVIDELGYLNLRPEQTNIFFKLMEERYRRKATIITTNLDYDDWYGLLGKKDMVSALLDRVRHYCHTIRIEGTSLREPVHQI
jgi:DNA replication protein DnaC